MSGTTVAYIVTGILFTALLGAAVFAWIRADRRDQAEEADYQRLRDALQTRGED